MQTKSYRALKWTLFMGMAATLASACVVSTGDGDDNDVTIEGGDGGTNNTSGTNTGGSKAGSSGSGGTTAGTSTAGTSSGGTGGDGGSDADPDYPGVCDSSLKEPTVVNAAACDVANDDNDCGACLKMKCCDPFKACYGKEPTSACGYGPSPADDLGQFDTILECYDAENDGIQTLAEILEICEPMSRNQCADTDEFANEDTMALVSCALNGADDEPTGTDDCRDVCFPPAD
jgi:hypothetical protein